MKSHCQLSLNTTAYSKRYQAILKEMIANMTSAELTQSISGDFIMQMLPHHRGAIEMSENLLQYTTNIPLQNIALHIISEQTKSIENLTAAYPCCQALINQPREVAHYQKKNECCLKTLFHEMEGACTDNSIDANFMREMIPHHRGAVCMATNALNYPLCPELIPILDTIVSSQKRGIRQMQQLLSQITCQ